jgi:hypothetical protein
MVEDARNAAEEYAKSLGYTIIDHDSNKYGTSSYLIIDNGKLDEDGDSEGPFTLRFSDHAQPFSRDNGEDITYMRNGKVYSAGYTIEAVIDNNYEIDLSDVWQFLEQHAPNNGNVRFSVIQMSEDEERDYVNILKPFMMRNPNAAKSEVFDFLKSKGVDVNEKTAWYCARFAAAENKSAIAKERVKRRNDWLYENVDLYRQVIDVAGSDFKIKPSLTFDGEDFTGSFISKEFRKYSRKRKQRDKESDKQYKNYLKRREKALANAEGMSSYEIAQAIAEKYGQDAQEVEQKLIDFFRDLTKNDLNRKYSDYLAEKNFETKELDRRLLLEWDRQQEQERIQEVLEIITKKGTLITPEWINENTKTYKKLYEMVLGEKAPGVPTKKQINALNVAIMNESDNAPELAKGYKIAYDQLTEEFNIKLRSMKDKMLADKFDVQQVQQAAKDFAYANVDRGFREKFISKAMNLGKFPNTKTAKYPDGRRQFELEKLMSEMLDFQENLHKQNAILEINQLLKRNKTKRTAKNVPYSPMGERQVALDRIAAVVKMSPETVAGVLRYDFEQKHALSEALEMLIDADEDTENKEGRILAEIRKIDNDIFYLQNFGALELKKVDAVEGALKKLKKFIKDGRKEFAEARNEDRERFNELRLKVRKEMNSGNLETPSQNELDKSVNPLENYTYMSMSLNDMFDILSGTDNMIAKDNSQAGKFERMVDEAAQKEQTMLNNMQSVFDKKLAEHGITSIVGRGRFLRSTMQEENTGVFVEEYAPLMKDGDNAVPQWDKGRPSRKEFVYVDHARKILEDLNNGEKIIELLPVQADDDSNKLEKLKLIREDLKKLTKNIGRTFTLTRKQDGNIRVYTDTDGGNVISLDFELADLPQVKSMIDSDSIKALTIDNFALHGAREQLIQYDAGITPESRLNMGDDIDDIQWQSFVEEGFKYDKVYFIGSNRNMQTRPKELILTPGAAVQLILTWEQEYYQPAMMWNGYSQETIDRLKNYLNAKDPALLEVAYALRDYVRDTQDELDRAVFERYGVHLPEQKNFWYADFKGNLTDRVQDAGFGNQSGGLTVNANFLTGRRLHFLAPSTSSNAFTLFLTKQLEQAHFVAWTQTIRTLRAVYNDKAVQFTLRKNFGQAFWNNFKEKLEIQAAGGVAADKAAQIVSGFYKTWAPSNIALNPASALKQLAGGLSYAHYVPVDKLMRYLPEANQWNPEYRRWRDFVMNSDFIKNRMEGTGLNPNLGGLLNFSLKGKKISPVADAMMKKMLTLTTSADVLSTTTWGYAAYQYFYDTAIKKGMSEKEAFDFAYRWWMKSTEKTQQSGYLKDLNSFSTKPLLRAFTTYMTNPMQTAALELTALQKVLKNPTTANKKNLINKFIVNHLIATTAMNLIGSMIKHGFNFEDWEEDLDNYIAGWLLGSFDSLFLVGQGLSALIAVLSNNYFAALNKFDFMPMFNDYIRDISKVKKFIEGRSDFDILDSMQIMGDLMMAGGPPVIRTSGILLRAVSKLGKRVEKWFED